MTAKEALEYFKRRKEQTELNDRVQQAEDLAIKALEKQIPKKPFDICTPVVTWGQCPACKGKLNKLGNQPNRVFKNQTYCMDCGQRLDWGETK